MNPVQKHLLDTGFADLAGSTVEGTLALSDAVMNLGLQGAVAKLLASPPPATDPAPASAPPEEASSAPPDPAVLLRKLRIERLEYRTETGRTLLEVHATLAGPER